MGNKKIALLLCILSIISLNISAENLIPNNGFEESLVGWLGSMASASIDTETVLFGSRSVKLTSGKTSEISIRQVLIPINAGETYYFSAWAKTANLSSGGKVNLKIEWADDDNKSVDASGKYSSDITGNVDWQKLELFQKAPAGATTARIYLKIYGPGVVWFDETHLDTVQEPIIKDPSSSHLTVYDTNPVYESEFFFTSFVTTLKARLNEKVSGVNVLYETIAENIQPGVMLVRFDLSILSPMDYKLTLEALNFNGDIIGQVEKTLAFVVDHDPPEPVLINVDSSEPGLALISWAVPKPSISDGDLPHKYIVYRSLEDDFIPCENNIVGEIEGLEEPGRLIQFLDTSATQGQLNYYKVASLDRAGNRAYSNQESVYVVSTNTAHVVWPRDNAMVMETSEFEWQPMEGVEEYIIQISPSELFEEENTIELRPPGNVNSYVITENISVGIWYWRIRAKFNSGAFSEFSEIETFISIGDGTESIIPFVNITPQPYNPRTESLTLSYALAKPGKVWVGIFSLEGRMLINFAEGQEQLAGTHQYNWKGSLKDGLYFAKIDIDSEGKRTTAYQKFFVWN